MNVDPIIEITPQKPIDANRTEGSEGSIRRPTISRSREERTPRHQIACRTLPERRAVFIRRPPGSGCRIGTTYAIMPACPSLSDKGSAMKLKTRIEGGSTPRLERWGVDSEYGRLREVLVGPVDHFAWRAGNSVAERSERVGLEFDFEVARKQYGEMLDVYRQAGVNVHTLPPDPDLPYQIFARDSSVMTPWGAVILQTLKPYRRGEYAACIQFYLDAGIPIYDLITAGNVEGGDVMVLKPGIAICGFSGERSIEPAVKQLQSWFAAEGWEMRTYEFDSHFLHLDVQMGMIAEGLAVVCVEAVEPELVGWLQSQHIRAIPISYGDAMQLGSNVVALGDERVLVPASSKNLIAACRAEGLTVYDPDVSMIGNGGGAVHCMCQALRRDRVSPR
jgi:N-dimethylarginine dimethylaminohydrolase